MATNEFLAFAADPAANVMLQSDYAATGFTSRILGFSTGTALSLQLNKVWRQASLIAAMIAQFSVDNTNQDALDDGSPGGQAALLTHFTQAIKTAALAGQSLNYLPLGGGTLTGPLTINAGAAQVTLNAPAGQAAGFTLTRPAGQAAISTAYTGGRARWQEVLASSEPETGGNVGSNYLLARFDDAGNYIDVPLRIDRGSGVVQFSKTPTINGGPLPYLPISGGSLTGPLYVPSPGITYGGTAGHWISFGWDGAAIVGYVDGGGYTAELASVNYVDGRVGAYLPLAGGTITGDLQVNNSFQVYGGTGFHNYVWFGGLTDFAVFAGGNFRYRQWAGNWWDGWDGTTGRRYWATYSGAAMQLDGGGNLSSPARFDSYGGGIVAHSDNTPFIAMSWNGWYAMGHWLSSDSALWLGQTDGSGNPFQGHQRFGWDGTFTNWNGITTHSWLQVGGATTLFSTLTVVGTLSVYGTGGSFVAASTDPNFVSWNATYGYGTGFKTDQGGGGSIGMICGYGDGTGLHGILSFLRSDGWFFVYGGIGSPSDAKLKTAIRPAAQFDSLGALAALDTVQFDWKHSKRHQPFGLLAEMVKKRLPDVIEPGIDGLDYLDHTALLVHLVRAVQQLEQRSR
jgi:hypothetical protein